MSRVVALCGGVGGAKLAFGLSRVIDAEKLTIIVNVGDDGDHLGLHVSPDIDTVLYTLSGLADTERGWGLAGETWNFMAAVKRIGGESWFNLGDSDLALHVERTRRLRQGESLSRITGDFAKALGIRAEIVPATDDPLRTIVETDEGDLEFHDYFVRRACKPIVKRVRFANADRARPSKAAEAALRAPDLSAVVICPSNPYLSVDPILAIGALHARLAALEAPRIAVSPIVGGKAIKGPAAKMMLELGLAPNVETVARHYSGLIDAIVLDAVDEAEIAGIAAMGIAAFPAQTVMRSDQDRIELARFVLSAAERVPQFKGAA